LYLEVSAAIVFRTEGHFHDLFDMPMELASQSGGPGAACSFSKTI
jgi:hypothetical protein